MNINLLRSGLFSVVILSVISCGKTQKVTNQTTIAATAVSVSTQTATLELVTGEDVYPGTVVPLNEVELRAQVGGYITRVFIQDGQKVQKGQKLYEIDRSKYDAAYRQALAGVQIAKSNRDKAKKDAERYQKLADQDAIAKQRVDYALTDLANAESQIAGAQAALANTLADLRRSVIVAPLSGTIGISQVKLGALVSPGSTLLNTVSTNDPIAVNILVPQQQIPRFISLQQNPRSISDSLFAIQRSDGSTASAAGKIVTIDRAVDSQTGSIRVRVSFPNGSGGLIPGMNTTVRVLNRSAEKQIVIPFKAVAEQLGEFTVFVVGDSSKVDQRPVKTGMKVADKIVITEGLKPGEVFVTEGVQNLRNGSVITTESASAQPTPKK
ncbi:MAG: efflux RND transporter periplasmic adaptor subunit [Bacteroidota bacterium]